MRTWHVLFSPFITSSSVFTQLAQFVACAYIFSRSPILSVSLSLSSMEGNSDSPESETTAGIDLAGKLNELLTEVEDLSSEFFIKEEMVAKFMQELYKEITCPSTSTNPNKQANDFPPPTLSSSSLSTSSSSALTVPFADCNKSESCGTSVSDPVSTLMAGIEYFGPAAKMGSQENGFGGGAVEEGGGCNYRPVGAKEGFAENQVDGCDVGELDDEWLGRVLSWDPSLLEDHCI